MKKSILPLVLCLLIPVHAALSQAYTLNKSASKMSVLGTSTLHDWESTVESFSASANADETTLTGVTLKAEVESIKSGKSGMDKNTYKAMKSDKFATITFTSDKLTVSGTKVTGSGNLTIAGVTKQIQVNLTMEQWNDDSFTVSGSIPLTMSNFGIDPPTAMMGTIKTGDEIEIKIDLSLKQ